VVHAVTLASASLEDRPDADARAARQGDPAALAAALVASRDDTLATFAACEQALGPALAVPCIPTLNPPRWELGHIGWFQEFWIARNPQRHLGVRADPDAPRPPSIRADGDALYNSSRVAHGTRWQLPLPDADATRADLARQLEATLDLLSRTAGDDASLYFFRLALFHEDMHHEAALYMARALDIDRPDPRWQPRRCPSPGGDLVVGPVEHRLGSAGPGFAFDNECAAHAATVDAFTVDRRVVSWREFLPFVEAGGYRDPRHWTEAGQAWLAATGAAAPRYLRHDGGAWLERRHGDWQALDLGLAAAHLTAHEAQAWCRWAGRRLPTEAEWECAALAHPQDFAWGQVWEWTASVFAPYPGFEPHPYRDYSAPWFGSRTVLRGASHLTQPRMRHRAYRNYFTAERNDIAAGFRSCPR
jgi:ergothioneine biosynthesis protein EgtB